MNSITYGNSAMVISAGTVPEPQRIPTRDILTYRAVEMQEGWVGQVIVDGTIVKEKAEFPSSSAAQSWAQQHISKKLQKLMA